MDCAMLGGVCHDGFDCRGGSIRVCHQEGQVSLFQRRECLQYGWLPLMEPEIVCENRQFACNSIN
jgi:hypothetical protein